MESWRAPTQSETLTIATVEGLIAAVHAEGTPPQIAAHLQVATEAGAERDVLLGARTRTEGRVPILDWRTAPLAEAFLRHRPGESYEIELADRVIAGRVLAEHRLELAGGAVVAIVDDAVELRRVDGAWRARDTEPPALPRYRSGAVAQAIELDPDQQRAVELPRDRSLVVDGEAGVGKTLVAMVRVAALATRARTAGGAPLHVVVLVPTEGLRRLCRRLADRLELDRLDIAIVDDWLVARARRAFPRLPARSGEDATAGVIALKRHPAVRDEIGRMLRWKPPRGDERVPRVRAALHELFGDQDRLARIAAAARLPARAVAEVMAHTHVQFTATTEEAHRHVDADRLIAIDGRAIDAGTPLGDAGTFDVEDVPVLFEMARRGIVRIDRDARLPRYDHIVLDEAQLRSPLELAAIGDALVPGASLTLAGDSRQDTDDSAWFAGWDAALAEAGRTHAERITLAITYRSAPSIAALARGVVDAPPARLPPEDPAVAATRCRGELDQIARLARALDALITRDPWRSIAVVGRNDDHARRIARELGRAVEVSVVLDGGFDFAPGIVVTAAPHIAGLEFDAVAIPDLSPGFYPAAPEIARSLYVAMTRARDWLWLSTPDAWSPLVTPRYGQTGS